MKLSADYSDALSAAKSTTSMLANNSLVRMQDIQGSASAKKGGRPAPRFEHFIVQKAEEISLPRMLRLARASQGA